jgi:hypothetical protein
MSNQALRALKKKLQRESICREMKLRRHFEKPSRKSAPVKRLLLSAAPARWSASGLSATAASGELPLRPV